MLRIHGPETRLCDGVTRREFIEIGGLSAIGLLWPDLLRAGQAPGRARSCIFIFLWGGPGQQDLWDLKPHAPAEVRGEFRPIRTNIPGTQISEQLPRLARQADKFTIIRSVTHKDFEHGSAAYTALTGHPHSLPGTNTTARPDDFPTYGSVVTKFLQPDRSVPAALVLGPVLHQGARPPVAGQNAGFLGRAHDPFRIAEDPNTEQFRVRSLELPTELTAVRLHRRRTIRELVDGHAGLLEQAPAVQGLDQLYRKAFELLGSPATRRAFELSEEPPTVRNGYGRTRFGQSLLLARRLVEAGVPMVTINWSKQNADQWDTHKSNYPKLRQLLPPFDRGLAALLEDLAARGLIESTLVVCLGEFGRTPRINSSAGRDHWPDCYSVLVAGGGIRAGELFGSSDRFAAYPASCPVAPWDLAATIYYCLGIDPDRDVIDPLGRPIRLAPGRVIHELLV